MFKNGFLLCLLLLLLTSKAVKASASGVSGWLKAGTAYKLYDLDGGGKKDTIKIKTSISSDGYAKANLYINGKKVYTVKKIIPYSNYSDCARIRIITLKNETNYIYFSVDNDSVSRDFLLQYKNKKISEISDFSSIMNKYSNTSYLSWYPNTPITVSGNVVYFNVSSMNWTVGNATFQLKYKYSNGTLKRVSSYGKISGGNASFVAAQGFSTYSSIGSNSIAFTVRTNETVTIQSFRIKSGKLWLCVRNSSGKTGWIKSLTKQGAGKSLLFSNAWYAS